MYPRCWHLFIVLPFLSFAGCASSGASGNAAAVAPPAAQGPADVYIAASPAAPPLPTLPEFLGINQIGECASQTCGGFKNLLDRLFPQLATAFPGAEAPPPLVPVSSPANLESPSPAVAAAAKIKQEEDQAQQKILALNYLATIGCGGCYPEVEDAFLAAMEDCTEEVRYAAVKAVKDAAGQPCTFCKSGACCSPEIRRKLMELSDQQDDNCCLTEPSARVRRLARIALASCGNNTPVPIPEIEGPVPVDQWETLPAAAAEREFLPLPPVTSSGAAPGGSNGGSSNPVHIESPGTEPVLVDELVAEWYQTVDPSLPVNEKKILLRAHLADQFRRRAEQAVLIQAAEQEYEFHKTLKTACSTDPQSDRSAEMRSSSADPGHVVTVAHAGSVPSVPNPAPGNRFDGILISWEQLYLDVQQNSREADIAMMNEIWRLMNQRKPNPAVAIQAHRLKVRMSGLVDLAEVPNPRMRELLATTPVGECSPVIVSKKTLFMVRILERREPSAADPGGLDLTGPSGSF